MKNTIKLLEEQHNVLVQVIQFLDRNRHSDTPVREAVDKILNHSDKLHKGSEMELTKISYVG
jgi:hemerythrin-like domain-containing protein